jgi:hypothetical protein
MMTSADWGDPYDYTSPIMLRLEYDIPGYAIITDSFLIFTPLLASNLFARANNHLLMDTGVESRKFPFRDRCSRSVDITESVRYPRSFAVEHLPPSVKTEGDVAGYYAYYQSDSINIQLYQMMSLGKRVYDPSEWTQFRKAVVAQKEYAKQPVILRRAR